MKRIGLLCMFLLFSSPLLGRRMARTSTQNATQNASLIVVAKISQNAYEAMKDKSTIKTITGKYAIPKLWTKYTVVQILKNRSKYKIALKRKLKLYARRVSDNLFSGKITKKGKTIIVQGGSQDERWTKKFPLKYFQKNKGKKVILFLTVEKIKANAEKPIRGKMKQTKDKKKQKLEFYHYGRLVSPMKWTKKLESKIKKLILNLEGKQKK